MSASWTVGRGHWPPRAVETQLVLCRGTPFSVTELGSGQRQRSGSHVPSLDSGASLMLLPNWSLRSRSYRGGSAQMALATSIGLRFKTFLEG